MRNKSLEYTDISPCYNVYKSLWYCH